MRPSWIHTLPNRTAYGLVIFFTKMKLKTVNDASKRTLPVQRVFLHCFWSALRIFVKRLGPHNILIAESNVCYILIPWSKSAAGTARQSWLVRVQHHEYGIWVPLVTLSGGLEAPFLGPFYPRKRLSSSSSFHKCQNNGNNGERGGDHVLKTPALQAGELWSYTKCITFFSVSLKPVPPTWV